MALKKFKLMTIEDKPKSWVILEMPGSMLNRVYLPADLSKL